MAEILEAQRQRLDATHDDNELRTVVVQMRVQAYQNRLMNEAGITPEPHPLFGFFKRDDE